MNGLALAMRKHRKINGIRQEDAAKTLRFTQTKLSRVELGQSKPYKNMAVIAEYLGLSAERCLKLLESPAGAEKDFADLLGDLRDVQDTVADMQTTIVGQMSDMRAMLVEALNAAAPPGAGVVADAIRVRRNHLGVTESNAAAMMKVPASTFRRMEEGNAAFDLYAFQVADFLEVSGDDLATMLNPPPPPRRRGSTAVTNRPATRFLVCRLSEPPYFSTN